MTADSRVWANYAEAFAFLGNSLLAPMSQTEDVGLDPAFWNGFPTFGSDEVARAACSCRSYAEDAARFAESGGDPVQRASVEYTELFVGPPKPAAAPWETFYRKGGVSSGFGEPTFEMRRLLREAGLEVSHENNQYADHIGIELLYLSVLCERVAKGEAQPDEAARFADERILSWIGSLKAKVATAQADGYFCRVLALAEAIAIDLARRSG